MVIYMNRAKKFGFFGVVAYAALACASFVPAFLFDFTAPALLSQTTGSVLCSCLFAALIAWCIFAKVKSKISMPQFIFYLSGGSACLVADIFRREFAAFVNYCLPDVACFCSGCHV